MARSIQIQIQIGYVLVPCAQFGQVRRESPGGGNVGTRTAGGIVFFSEFQKETIY